MHNKYLGCAKRTDQLSLTSAILKLKSIKAAEKIGMSSNAKVYLGSGGSKGNEIALLLDQVFESRQPQVSEQK